MFVHDAQRSVLLQVGYFITVSPVLQSGFVLLMKLIKNFCLTLFFEPELLLIATHS
jgi:hypothetical protein